MFKWFVYIFSITERFIYSILFKSIQFFQLKFAVIHKFQQIILQLNMKITDNKYLFNHNSIIRNNFGILECGQCRLMQFTTPFFEFDLYINPWTPDILAIVRKWQKRVRCDPICPTSYHFGFVIEFSRSSCQLEFSCYNKMLLANANVKNRELFLFLITYLLKKMF